MKGCVGPDLCCCGVTRSSEAKVGEREEKRPARAAQGDDVATKARAR